MVITKRQDVNDQYSEENFVFGEVLLVLVHLWGWKGEGGGGVGFCCGRLFEVEWKGEGVEPIQGWALINFFCLWDGRLLEVVTNSRLGAYSNKYGTCTFTTTLSGLGLMIFAKSGGGSFNTSF